MEQILPLLIDAALVIVVLLMIWLGYHRGFVRTAVYVVGYLAAVIVASLLGSWLGDQIAMWCRGPLVSYTSEQIGAESGSLAASVQALYDSAPGFLQGWMNQFGTSEQLAERIAESTSSVAQSAADGIADTVLLPLVSAAAGAVLFFVIFLILCFLVRRLAAVSGILDHVPVLGGLNHLAGGLIGIVQAAIVAFLLVLVLSAVLACVQGGAELAAETVIFRWCNSWMPFFRFS